MDLAEYCGRDPRLPLLPLARESRQLTLWLFQRQDNSLSRKEMTEGEAFFA
jgi:hypothetical protein